MAEPRGTYRLQLRPGFGFAAAAALCPYLSRLGVSHVYLSPSAEAVPGSTHGYDVVDPTALRGELGGAEGFDTLCAAARGSGLGVLLDIVPNHMAADPVANLWWRDVLEDGPQSPYATWFDIDWTQPGLQGRLLVPLLDGSPEDAIGSGTIRPRRAEGTLEVQVGGGATLPLAPASTGAALTTAADAARSAALRELARSAAVLAPSADTSAVVRSARARLRAGFRRDVAALAASDAAALDRALADLGRDSEGLTALLGAQRWALADWRDAETRLNHRRFFTLASYCGFRVEDAEARAASHRLVLSLVESGRVEGLRVDHVDGLRDPAAYLAWLAGAGARWVVVEKILGDGEALPPGWRAAGTTGYEVAADLAAGSVHAAGAARLRLLRDSVAGRRPSFAASAAEARRGVVTTALRTDVSRLVRCLLPLAGGDAALTTAASATLRAAVEALLVAMPVYRTAVDPVSGSASAANHAAVRAALEAARRDAPELPEAILRRVADLLRGEGWDADGRAAEFVARFQQLSPAIAAKGVEDCALYRDTAVLALADVGCAPDREPVDGDALAARLCARSAMPLALSATSTHDSKRSEDVRARLCVLTEVAEEWAEAVEGWREANAAHRRGGAPDADTELMLYQTAAGAWPIDADRLRAFAVKAVREAARRTAWTAPDPAHEAGVERFVSRLLSDSAWVGELEAFVARHLRRAGAEVSLGWTVLRCVAPGIVDVYQGCEIWERNLVDPDNRRPVDFRMREDLLDRLDSEPVEAAELAADLDGGPGLCKLAALARGLEMRRRRADVLGPDAPCASLPADGPRAAHAVGLARGRPASVVAIATRLPALLARAGGFGETAIELPEGRWRDRLTGATWRGRTPLRELLAPLPAAMLEREG